MSEKKVKLVAVTPIGLGGGERAETGEDFEIEESLARRLLKKGAAKFPEEEIKKPEPKRAGRNKADDGGGEG